jgi:hypothetical protein
LSDTDYRVRGKEMSRTLETPHRSHHWCGVSFHGRHETRQVFPFAVTPEETAFPYAAQAALNAAFLPALILSGFIALSLEILWFRVLGVVLKSNSFTFATLLAIYLAGLGGGALLGSRGARRVANAGEWFLILQSAITLYAGLSLTLLTWALGRTGALDLLWHYLGDYEALDSGVGLHDTVRLIAHGGRVAGLVEDQALLFLTLYGAVPALVVGVPTLLMGASFAFLQRAAQTDPSLVGRRVGGLQTANIVGSTVGIASATSSLNITSHTRPAHFFRRRSTSRRS